MGYMIQISDDKRTKMSELCEKMLHAGGKLMQCLESLGDEPERDGRDDDMDEEDEREERGYSRYGRMGSRKSHYDRYRR